mgnify:FL=1
MFRNREPRRRSALGIDAHATSRQTPELSRRRISISNQERSRTCHSAMRAAAGRELRATAMDATREETKLVRALDLPLVSRNHARVRESVWCQQRPGNATCGRRT